MIGLSIPSKPSTDDLTTAINDTTTAAIGIAKVVSDLTEVAGISAIVRLQPPAMTATAPPTIEIPHFILVARAPSFAREITAPIVNREEPADVLLAFVFWCKYGILHAVTLDHARQLYIFATRYNIELLRQDIDEALRECRDLWDLADMVASAPTKFLPAELWQAAAAAIWQCLEADANITLPRVLTDELLARLMRYKWAR